MDLLDLKRQYESLGNDELMRVWADKAGLTEVAFSVLSEEVAKRGLLNSPWAPARLAALKTDLVQNRVRVERFNRRVVRRGKAFIIGAVLSLLIALVVIMIERFTVSR